MIMKNSKFLLINKPINLSSFNVCYKLKKHFNFKKVGHAGTLDPNATGLLVIAYNENTKLLNDLKLDEKEYEATIKFNIQTDTFDLLGKIKNTTNKKVNFDDLDKVLKKYNNSFFYQKPPIFSAIKYKGKKLYDYARKNIELELKKRKVYVNFINLKSFDYDNQECVILINVSKGFYVRSFANDLGIELNNFGFLKSLNRTKSGCFSLENAINLDEILKLDPCFFNS